MRSLNTVRTKKVKQAYEAIHQSELILTEPKIITSDKPIVLEVGSGKGKFITELAVRYPEFHFVAFEKDINVCYRILEKQNDLKLPNLTIVQDDANALLQYFNPKSVQKLYLNFSDPWPKKRHHKRRLTAKTFLDMYESILSESGELEFRSDFEPLYQDSLEYLSESHFEVYWASTACEPREAVSEYEEKKRKESPIFGFKAILK
ncbi:tRNA (guanosine(46)-N7)-methyltransferase TrmB [Acholeplasma vituli]|uniref:tRNA (guanine-N(7)-)-methyltransferase n=1 Tax=Paracholeplasma vituli TaxID=69473 RepID=A0ABT2PZF4_9MOLU|nr:tRNA (guanosine(46)-N7)-methyltransferase TrmB [Paracholeplasma vituli]